MLANRIKSVFLDVSVQVQLVSLSEDEMYYGEQGTKVDHFSPNGNDVFQFPDEMVLALNFVSSSVEDALLPDFIMPNGQSAAQDKSCVELGHIDLEQCLDAFTQLEELAQDDWVRCEKTQKFERSLKKLNIWTLPQRLIIVLKR